MKYRRLLCLLLCLMMISFVGCSSVNNEVNADETTPPAQTQPIGTEDESVTLPKETTAENEGATKPEQPENEDRPEIEESTESAPEKEANPNTQTQHPGGVITGTTDRPVGEDMDSTTPEKDENQETKPELTQPTEPTQSEVTQHPGGVITGTTDRPNNSAQDIYVDMAGAYTRYNAMTGAEQQRFLQEYFDGNLEEFVNWYNAAKEEYNKKHPAKEIG